MSLYESLDVFVGAGVISLAPAGGHQVPPGAARRGYEFSALLRSRGEGDVVGEVLDRLAHEVWLSQDARGIQMHVAEEHARKLAAILDVCGPDERSATAAFDARKGADGAVAHIRLASQVMAHATRQRLIESMGLSAGVSTFLLEQLYANLLMRPKLLDDLGPALGEFLNKLASEDARAAPAPAQAVAVVLQGP